jgi:hypothetical protein
MEIGLANPGKERKLAGLKRRVYTAGRQWAIEALVFMAGRTLNQYGQVERG